MASVKRQAGNNVRRLRSTMPTLEELCSWQQGEVHYLTEVKGERTSSGVMTITIAFHRAETVSWIQIADNTLRNKHVGRKQ